MANNAVLESLSMAVPIVATDFPAVRDYTGEGPALFVKGNNPMTFAAVIESLLHDSAQRAAMSAAGRARAVAALDWRAVADAYRVIYRNLLGRPARAT